MLKPENKKSIILILLLFTVLLALLVYKPLFTGLPLLASEEETLTEQKNDLERKRSELEGRLPDSIEETRAQLEAQLASMSDMSNNYDFHYELVDLAASFGLHVTSLQIGDPQELTLDGVDFESAGCTPTLRVVTITLSGAESSFLEFADAVNALGENVRVDVSFSPYDSSQGYVLTARFYNLSGLEAY